MDLLTIKEAINTLVESDTTPQNVAELASLYICKGELEKLKFAPKFRVIDGVEEEWQDILPYYQQYKDVKKRYQLGQTNEGEIIQGIKKVCLELKEFIEALYSGTDMNKERLCIQQMLRELYSEYIN